MLHDEFVILERRGCKYLISDDLPFKDEYSDDIYAKLLRQVSIEFGNLGILIVSSSMLVISGTPPHFLLAHA
ncbi:hypothetical protein SORBI_3001G135700 [Sorghum bicolor]|uniref:Uncharacterized protein n=1 Tax=Sorghum bicolor TaxID=4558 RepID=A0A1B6QIU2_SORBI|nr:hypothetical protein SORBI_3001G135700 [Sorghum bicolor]